MSIASCKVVKIFYDVTRKPILDILGLGNTAFRLCLNSLTGKSYYSVVWSLAQTGPRLLQSRQVTASQHRLPAFKFRCKILIKMSESVAVSSKKLKKKKKKGKRKSDNSRPTPSLGLNSRNEQSITVEEDGKNSHIENGTESSLEEKIKNVDVQELHDTLIPVGLAPMNNITRTDDCSDEDWGWQTISNITEQQRDVDLQKKDRVERFASKLAERNVKELNLKLEPSCQQMRCRGIDQEQIPDAMQKVKVPAKSDCGYLVGECPTGTVNLECTSKLQLKKKNKEKKRSKTNDDHLNISVNNCMVKNSIVIPNIQVDNGEKSCQCLDNSQQLTSSKSHTGDTIVNVLARVTETASTKEHSDQKAMSNLGNFPCKDTAVMSYVPTNENCNPPGGSVTRHLKTNILFQNELSDFPPLNRKSSRPTSYDHSQSAVMLLRTTAIDQGNPEKTDLSFGSLVKSSAKAVFSVKTPSPPSRASPKSKKSKRKWSKLDLQYLEIGLQSRMLVEEVVYEAVVVETRRSTFIAVVEQDIRVLVYNNCFKPMGAKTPLQMDMPITCVLKLGDHVRLTAIRKTRHSKSKDGEDWMAKECWQEQPMLAHGSNKEVSYQSTVARVGVSAVELTDGTFVFANKIFLFGFHLAHADVDLRDIFQLGDQLTYRLPHDILECPGPPEAETSWFGSLPANGNDKPSNQQQFELMAFLKARRKDVPMSVITAVCGLNKNATCIKDDFEDVYKDIFSTEDQMLPTIHADCTTINGGQLTVVAERQNNVKKTSTKSVLSKKVMKQAEMKNKIENGTLSPTSLSAESAPVIPESTAKSKMVDVATQTHATGDLMCFYTMYCSDSD